MYGPEVVPAWFTNLLKKVENGPRIGFDKEKKLWFPHHSIEGGTDTIAYGHKLTNEDVKNARFKHGLSDDEVNTLLASDIEKHFKLAKEDYEKHFSAEGLHTTWDNLPEWGRLLLTEIHFNTGSTAAWKKLRKNCAEGKFKPAIDEAITHYTNEKGERVALTHRHNDLVKAFENAYPQLVKK